MTSYQQASRVEDADDTVIADDDDNNVDDEEEPKSEGKNEGSSDDTYSSLSFSEVEEDIGKNDLLFYFLFCFNE